MLVSLVLDWISVGGQHVRGLTIAWEEKRWLLLVPVSGAVLLASAASRSHFTRVAALVAGGVVAGDLVVELMWGMMRGGVEPWLIFGGAIAMMAGMANSRRALRALGGLAVLAGFFAPWSDMSMASALCHGGDLASEVGITAGILWAIPAAGAIGVASMFGKGAWGARLPLIAGIAVFGAFLWFLGSAASLILAWGAWATLGASAVALVIGVLAPAQAPVPAAAK
jgi:hypothetical protein